MTVVFLRAVPGPPASFAVIAVLALVLSSCASSPGSPTVATHSTTTTMAAGTTSSTATSSTATSTTAAGTQEVQFDPFSAQGTLLPTEQVTVTVSGTCVTPGVAGTTSYRCFAHPNSAVYDPCFAAPGVTSGTVECIADPATPEVVDFDAGALPQAPLGAAATRPWAMQLANGQVCILVAAAWGGLGPFACPTPGATRSVADCHVPQPAAPWWSTACQVQENATRAFSGARVVKVWT